MKNKKKYSYIQIGIASPEEIRSWSFGEVKKHETINYRTLKPERDGLFCEAIFGPQKDYQCACGKSRRMSKSDKKCDRCGVDITESKVRRERMGHIELASSVVHTWFLKNSPCKIATMLDLKTKDVEDIVYLASYIVVDPGSIEELQKEKGRRILTAQEYASLQREYGSSKFKAKTGAEAIKYLLQELNLDEIIAELREELKTATKQKREKAIKRLEVVEAFSKSGNKPEWMVMDVIPVLPPDLRPMVQLDGGRFATTDLNDLYRRIIIRNNRLIKQIEQRSPGLIIKNEKRMLQESVDALIDNGKRNRKVAVEKNRPLKSLSDLLRGKQGRFRQNLLGKRVDYSGRSVICVGPDLQMYQCGIPREMALILFKPFIINAIINRPVEGPDQSNKISVKDAKTMIEQGHPIAMTELERIIVEHPVLLNRAPTLHRLGIQAFEPVLVEGKAIKLHPLVCTAFNADFDGDQMAVHLPLTQEAQAECRFLLLSPNNLLKPSDGGLVAVPSQDMILGVYYLTQERPGSKGEGNAYKNINEAILAYENGECTLHSRIKVRVQKENAEGELVTGTIESTLGRFLFNEIIPQDLGFVDRTKPENLLKLEVDYLVGKKQLKPILEKVINIHGASKTAEVLDNVKDLGYHYSTKAAITVSISDIIVPDNKQELIDKAQAKVDEITKEFNRGRYTEEERYRRVVDTWNATDDELTDELMAGLDAYNNIKMMADSGARGSKQQIKQLAGMRGLMADTTGRTIELPVKSNFREGMDVLEYFMAAHGGRKGLADTALRTADSGYLTRRMVDVCQELIIREVDCAEGKDEIPGRVVRAFAGEKAGEDLESLQERITGRVSCEEIKDADGNVIVKRNHMITPSRAAKIMSVGVDKDGKPIEEVKIRTILTCKSHVGICAKCYGANMASGETVQVGEAVGIIAAQSIGEPGTQLTMRTFHTGGVAGEDITQGLPRVEELFEARKPKRTAILTEIDGVVTINDNKKKREIIVTNSETGETKEYPIPYKYRIKVVDGAVLEAGDELTEGSINPHDLLKIKGIRAVQDYMIREVQSVYRLQGVDISDKHIEIIVHQMLKKVRVENNGDASFLPGTLVDVLDYEETNEKLVAEGKEPAEGKQVLLGITKAALATDSFLSAASFQETTKVLTEAAIKGKMDTLIGLKENVILGKLIPAGTGMKRYRNTLLDTDKKDSIVIPEDAMAEVEEGAVEETVMDEVDEVTEEMVTVEE